MTNDDRKQVFNEEAQRTLRNLDYRFNRAPETIAILRTMGQKADSLLSYDDQLLAAQLMAPYISDQGTLGPALLDPWAGLVRKIAEKNPRVALMMATEGLSRMENKEGTFYKKVALLHEDVMDIARRDPVRARAFDVGAL